MNISPLVYALTIAAMGLLFPLFNSFGNREKHQESVCYTYPVGFRIFIWVGSIGFTLMAFIFKAFGINGEPWQWFATEIIGAILIAGCVYTDKYVVQLKSNCLICGSFKKTNLPYTDIKSIKINNSGRGKYLVITDKKNKNISVSGNIRYFEDLVINLKKNMRT